VEEAEITGSWQADGKSYVNYTCLKCGEAGMSPVKDNE
jgi:RNase P subunit RPR2|tara:strand:+ start:276 stop:389 length:114 start_codon:yes stop_codon:yes gene_type:complete